MLKDIRIGIEKHIKDILLYILFLCILAVFEKQLSEYISNLCVEFPIDVWQSSKAIFILFTCIILLTLYYLWKRYVPSNWLLLITTTIGLFIIYSKLYTEEKGCTVISLFILVLFVTQFIIFTINKIKVFCRQIRNYLLVKIEDEKDGFYTDKPIPVEEKLKSPFVRKILKKFFGIEDEKLKTDNKGYEQYAKNIANKIKATHHDEAFAIGINGKWGSGKTSISNLIERHLKSEKDVVIIKFKPWNSNTIF